VVRFTYGSEKESWIDAVTDGFNRQGRPRPPESGSASMPFRRDRARVNEIKDGRAGPDEVHATSPASDLYVNLINYEAGEQQGGDLLKVEGFLVSSPVVIAVWEPVLATLGPIDQVGWAEIFKRSGEGRFRYGQTNPETSNSGLSALIAQFYAGPRLRRDTRFPGCRRPRSRIPRCADFVAKVHESVIHYGRSTGFYADKMRDGRTRYADAAVVYESDVIQANHLIREKGLPFPKLVAVYPAEGTFATNHPFAIVKRDWVDADEDEGAKRYFAYLMSPEVQAQALQYGFRPSVALDVDPKIYGMVWSAENGVQPFDTVHAFWRHPAAMSSWPRATPSAPSRIVRMWCS
jgi:Ca-activated chloride channel homolog